MTDHDQLLANVNPIPDPTMLETEAFSLDDVVDRIGQPGETLVPATPLPPRHWRPAAVAAATFVLVAAAIAGGVVSTRSDNPAVGGSSETEREAGTADYYGSTSYNPFIGIRQSLLSQSAQPVFIATVDGYPAEQLYFQLLTLESFNGAQFHTNRLLGYEPSVVAWTDPDHASSGPAVRLSIDVGIERLRMDWLPAPVAAVGFSSPDVPPDDVRVYPAHSALRLTDEITHEGMTYTVEVDTPELDIGALITDAEGRLTPLFAGLPEAAELTDIATGPGPGRSEPPDADRYLDLTEIWMFPKIWELAESVTADAGSIFEEALYLEAWFRSDAFTYSLEVEPGHDAISIADWLLEPESPQYHVGYTEQFATALAVMARSIDIPSRVVLGFTPGEPNPDQEDLVVIRDRHAHAWVELWIPQQGWVRFDPTPRPDAVNTPTFERVGHQLGFDLLPYLTGQ